MHHVFSPWKRQNETSQEQYSFVDLGGEFSVGLAQWKIDDSSNEFSQISCWDVIKLLSQLSDKNPRAAAMKR